MPAAHANKYALKVMAMAIRRATTRERKHACRIVFFGASLAAVVALALTHALGVALVAVRKNFSHDAL
jgi:predicted MFS family arabinose efflux permease